MSTVIAPGPMKSGRPRAKANENKPRFWETDLYKLLVRRLPDFVENGRMNVRRLSEAAEFHHFTVSKWLNNNRISPKGAESLIKLSKGKLSPKDLAQFVIS